MRIAPKSIEININNDLPVFFPLSQIRASIRQSSRLNGTFVRFIITSCSRVALGHDSMIVTQGPMDDGPCRFAGLIFSSSSNNNPVDLLSCVLGQAIAAMGEYDWKSRLSKGLISIEDDSSMQL